MKEMFPDLQEQELLEALCAGADLEVVKPVTRLT